MSLKGGGRDPIFAYVYMCICIQAVTDEYALCVQRVTMCVYVASVYACLYL